MVRGFVCFLWLVEFFSGGGVVFVMVDNGSRAE